MKGSRKIFFRFLYLDKTTRKSLWFIACLLTLSVLTAQNNTKLDSLYRIYNASAEDTNKVQILNEICKEYQKGDGAQLLKNAETMLNLSIRLKYLKGQAQAYHHLSAYYEYSEDLNKALHYELLNYQINTKRGDSLLISKSYHNIGWLYECLGQHNKALEYCYKKIYILNKIKPSDFKKRALPTYEIMGLIFKSIKIHDSAIYYLDLSHKLAIEESDVRALSSVLVNKGIIYEETKDYSKAEKLYLQATKVAIEGSFTNNLSGAYQGLAGVYLHTGKYNLAIEYANKALDIAIPSGHKLWELYCYEVLEKAHKENNDFKNALVYSDKLRTLKDTMHINSNALELSKLQSELENSEKAQRIAVLEKEKAEVLSKAATERLKITIALSISILILSIFAFLLWRNKRIKIQRETEFAKARVILEHQALRAQMNPHFIFNSLNSIQRLFVEGKTHTASDVIADFSNLLRRILNNSSETEISLKEEIDTLKLYMDIEKIRCNNCFSYSFTIDEEIDLFNTRIPPLVFQPFVENAIWHGILPSKKPGIINISINYTESGAIRCVIQDNGIGIKQKDLDKSGSKGLKITEGRLGNKITYEVAKDGGTVIKFLILANS